MKNQEKDKIGRIFLTTLTKLAKAASHPDQRMLDYQYDVFQSVIIDLTGTDKLLFNTLFARIAYLGIQFKLETEFLYELHLYRKEKVHLTVFPESQNVYQLGLYVLAKILKDLYVLKIPERVLTTCKKPPYEKKEPHLESFVARMRGLVTGQFKGTVPGMEDHSSNLLFISEDQPDIELLIVTDQLDLFQNSLAHLKTWDTAGYLPITVEIRDIGIDKQGNLHPKWIVLEPDYLVDVTAVAECFAPQGASADYYLLNKFLPVEPSKYLLIGHLVNFVLDEMIHNAEISFDSLLKQLFHRAPLAFSLLDNNEVVEIVQTVKKHYYNLKRVITDDFPGLELNAEECIVEPSFYAPGYGIQGRIDVLYQKRQDKTSIIELKSGSPFRENMYGLSVNHYTQTLLYDLMIRSVFPYRTKPLNYILYSKLKQQNLRFAPTIKTAQMEAISIRNDIYAIERTLAGSELDDAFYDRINVAAFPAAFGFLKGDIERFEKMYRSLDQTEKAYFRSMTSFVVLEHHYAKTGIHGHKENNGLASLWLNDQIDKQDRFSIFTFLVITENLSKEDTATLQLTKTEKSNELANFRVGDIVILRPSPRAGDPRIYDQMIRATLIELGSSSVVIKLRSRQYNQRFFRSVKFWDLEPDFLDSGFRKMFQSLFSFGNAADDARKLLLGRKAPEKPQNMVPIDQNSKLTGNQKKVLQTMLSSPDYFLLWGPPGTGKTSVMIAAAVDHLMKSTEQHILLLAYTNRAVDEMCQAIESVTEPDASSYLRIGSRYATGEAFRKNLLDNQMDELNSRQKLRDKIMDTRIIIGTTSSISGKPELFNLKKFDLVIIDEASQILEPMIIGMLPAFRKFILIGDHKQLPAVVVQDSRESLVKDPELIELGIRDRRTAFFERLYLRCMDQGWNWAIGQLDEQGRMHKEIQAFANAYFYGNSLHCLPFEKRLAEPLPLKFDPKFRKQAIANHRMLFMDVRTEDTYLLAKNSTKEADTVANLVKRLLIMYRDSGLVISDATIGVITPFRAQIAQLLEKFRQFDIDPGLVSVDTVERYQGGARDIIIFSTVVNSEQRFRQIISEDENHLDRKLNVVISRAKEQFILVGNETILSSNWLYSQLLKTCQKINPNDWSNSSGHDIR